MLTCGNRIVNGIASILKAIINGIASVLDIIISWYAHSPLLYRKRLSNKLYVTVSLADVEAEEGACVVLTVRIRPGRYRSNGEEEMNESKS